MHIAQRLRLAVIVAILVWLGINPRTAATQGTQGQNAICSSSSGCSTVGSSAFIDASMFPAQGRDFCGVLNFILSQVVQLTYPAGAVIDARGLPGTTSTSMVCASGTSPWFNGNTYANVPSTILLPAATITIPATWVLPAGTKLIGEGSAIPGAPTGTATIIQACTNGAPAGCSTNFSGVTFTVQPCMVGVGSAARIVAERFSSFNRRPPAPTSDADEIRRHRCNIGV